MQAIGPREIQRILSVTDTLGIHRESVAIPLARQGGGSLRVTPAQRLEIVAPAEVDLEPWLASLAQRIQALNLSEVRRAD